MYTKKHDTMFEDKYGVLEKGNSGDKLGRVGFERGG